MVKTRTNPKLQTSDSKTLQLILLSLFYVILIFILLEGVLRIQQSLGPIYDLEFNAFIRSEFLSDMTRPLKIKPIES